VLKGANGRVRKATVPGGGASDAAPPAVPRSGASRLLAGIPVLLVSLAIPLSGCGESQQEKSEKAAIKTVCSARADIKSRLATLKTLTLSPVALPQLKEAGTAIFDDLKKIKEAQPNLEPTRKQQVQRATKTFQQQVSSTISGLTSLSSTASLASAGAQFQGALTQLENSYAQAFGPIACGGSSE
jgi:hypothetical protein